MPTPTKVPTSEPTSAPTATSSRLLTITDRMITCFSSCATSRSTPVSEWTSADYCSYYQTTGCSANIISEYNNKNKSITCPPSCLNNCADVYCSAFSILAHGGCGGNVVTEISAIKNTTTSCLANYRYKAGSVTFIVMNSPVYLFLVPSTLPTLTPTWKPTVLPTEIPISGICQIHVSI